MNGRPKASTVVVGIFVAICSVLIAGCSGVESSTSVADSKSSSPMTFSVIPPGSVGGLCRRTWPFPQWVLRRALMRWAPLCRMHHF